MARFEAQAFDEYNRPVAGAKVYIYDVDGVLMEVSDDEGTPLEQPLGTDTFGIVEYYANETSGRRDFYVNGRKTFSEVYGGGTAEAGKVNSSGDTMTGPLIVPDEGYGSDEWNGDFSVPTKNAVRDKIVGLEASIGSAGSGSISPMSYGAVGNGVTNDKAAIEAAHAAAHAAGMWVDGEGLTYGVTGYIEITDDNPRFRNIKFKQLTAGSSTLFFNEVDRVYLDDLYFASQGTASAGTLASGMAMDIRGGSGHRVRNVEATGNGKGTYLGFSGCQDSDFENLYVHDGFFNDVAAGDDVVQGIAIFDTRNCRLINPRVKNLLGNATYPDTSGTTRTYPNLRTRGIAGGGNINLLVIDPQIENTEQSIDFSGSGSNWGNRNLTVLGGHTRNAGSVGVKLANAPYNCKVIGHTSENAGMYNFLLTGYDATTQGRDNQFIGCTAVNPGYNMIENNTDYEAFAHSGFLLQQSGAGGLIGSRLVNCRAIDRQGFYLAGDDSPWAAIGATSATLAEAWTGYTGTYTATFTTGGGAVTKTVTLTNGATTCTWSGGLASAIINPFVSRPAQMRYGALNEAGYHAASARPNELEGFQSVGHTLAHDKGFHRDVCLLNRFGAQSIPNSTNTAVQWVIETENSLDMWDSSDSTKIYPKRPGRYEIKGFIQFAASSGGYRRAQIKKDGVTHSYGSFAEAVVSGESTNVPFLTEVEFTAVNIAANSYLEVFAEQTSGGALNLNIAEFLMRRVEPR